MPDPETQVLLWIHARSAPWLDAIFVASHFAGRTPVQLGVTGLLIAWFAARREWSRAGVVALLGWLAFLLVDGAKVAISRPRPELWPRLVEQGAASFPSGHAAISAALYTLIAAEIARHRPRHAPWLYALAVAGSLWQGLGRLYLGVHWPTDVLAGWAIGAALAWLGLRAWRRCD